MSANNLKNFQLAPEAPEVPTAEDAGLNMAKEIRLSVGLAPNLYHPLTKYTSDQAMKLGVPRVPFVMVIRELLAELIENQEWQERMASRLRKRYMEKSTK